ncbi:hypothetical protein ABZ061_28520 [Streptomyces mutabilis]|uniref:hypothetical protein n=1 Tax=Streptomyces mutabilis TaxID=67332 RepID=UPI0033A8752E
MGRPAGPKSGPRPDSFVLDEVGGVIHLMAIREWATHAATAAAAPRIARTFAHFA